MMNKILVFLFVLLFSVSCSYKKQLTAVKISLSDYYADGMVLQASPSVHISGYAKPGGVLAVKIDTYLKMARADKKGHWEVIFPEIINDKPFRLSIEGKDKIIRFNNVRAGKVIVLAGNAGQSYLAAQLDSCRTEVANLPENIHIFCPSQKVALKPQMMFHAGLWHTAKDVTWKKEHCRDIALIRQLITDTSQAVGVIDLMWRGTSLDAWLPDSSTLVAADTSLPHFDPDTILQYNRKNIEKIAHQLASAYKGVKRGVTRIWYHDSIWKRITLPVNLSSLANIQENRVVYLRKHIPINSKYLKSDFTIHLGVVHGNAEYYFNRQKIQPTIGKDGSVTLHIPSSTMKVWLNMLAIRMICTDEKAGIYGKYFQCLNADSSFNKSIAGGWRYNFNLEDKFSGYLPVEQYPSLVYNSFLAPLKNISYASFFWYQHDLNCDDAVKDFLGKTCELMDLIPDRSKKFILHSSEFDLDTLICSTAISSVAEEDSLKKKNCPAEFIDLKK